MLLFLYLHLKSFSFRFKKLTVNRFTWTETKILPRPAHFPISYMLLKLRFCEPLTRCPRSPLGPGWPGAPGAPCRDIAKIHLTGLTGLSLLNTSGGFRNLERGVQVAARPKFSGLLMDNILLTWIGNVSTSNILSMDCHAHFQHVNASLVS